MRDACRGDGDSEPSAKRSNAEARAKVRADARCRGDGDSEPSAKRSNAEARTKVRADARAGVMGTLNQVQKGQMQRRAQRCAQMRAQG